MLATAITFLILWGLLNSGKIIRSVYLLCKDVSADMKEYSEEQKKEREEEILRKAEEIKKQRQEVLESKITSFKELYDYDHEEFKLDK